MPFPDDPNLFHKRLALAQVVRARRKALGLTQQQLAERSGCNLQTISRIENAARSTHLDRAYRVAEGLGMSLSALFIAMEERPCWPTTGG
jgi:transcriptional regulator with XRE-family HTH domain